MWVQSKSIILRLDEKFESVRTSHDNMAAATYSCFLLTSLQNQQMLGIEFDDLGALDNNTFLWTFEPESDHSYLYQPQQQYPGYNQPWQ